MTDDQGPDSAGEQGEDIPETDAGEPDPGDAETGTDGSDPGDAETGITDDDFVRLDYTIRTTDDGQVVDTTRQDVAEEAGIDEEDAEFSPRVVAVGAGHVFQSVDRALVGAAAGDTGTVEVPAAEAFGEFDPDEVQTVSAEKVPEDDRYPGAQVRIDGQQGHLETIIGGRARVDFNHPLAGEDLEYEYEIVEIVEDRAERARGLLGMYLQEDPEIWIETDEIEEELPDAEDGDEEGADADAESEGDESEDGETRTVEEETLYIEATPQMSMNQQWLFSKQQVAQQLIDRLGVDRVIVQETLDGMGGMGGLGGMAGGMGGGDIEEALEDVDVDAEEIAEELDEADIDAE